MGTPRVAVAADRLFVGLAALLTLYMAVSTFAFLQAHSLHRAALVFGIVVLASLLAVRDALVAREARRGLTTALRVGLAGVLLVAAVVSTGYVYLHATRLEIEQPFLSDLDVMMGGLFVTALLLANWFHWGTVLTAVIAAVIAYFFAGHLLTNPILRHPPYELPFVMSYMGMNTTEGAFAYLADGVEKLYFLVIFSAVLIGIGMLDLVIEMGKGMGRYVRGGAAFPAIMGSTMVGTVMGAAVSNVVLTGRLTIPMMRRYGFPREFAGAIEAAASTAGQIIPPLMGLAAFVMAAFLNVPYITIALNAVIPAALYVTGVAISVLVRARRDDLPRLAEPVAMAVVARLMPTFLIPFLVVLVLMLWFYSPSFAGLFGIAAILLLCPLQGPLRPSLPQLGRALKEGLEMVVQLSLLLVAIGPLAQTFVTTNLSGRLSSFLVLVLPDSTLVLLIGAMALALLLGMGLPTPAAYVLAALTLGHFVQERGIAPIPAHFFIQYFAVFSALTPPVALAILAAAKIAGSGLVATAVEALKLVLPAFLIPFAFVYHPSLLAFPDLPLAVLRPLTAIVLVQWAIAVAAYGFSRRPLGAVERCLFGLAAAAGVVYLVRPATLYFWVFVAVLGGVVLGLPAARAVQSRARARAAPETS